MSGPKARKFTCSKCKVFRWCENFGGRSAAKLTDSSICDFCELENRFTARLARLEREKEALEVEVATLKRYQCGCKNSQVHPEEERDCSPPLGDVKVEANPGRKKKKKRGRVRKRKKDLRES